MRLLYYQSYLFYTYNHKSCSLLDIYTIVFQLPSSILHTISPKPEVIFSLTCKLKQWLALLIGFDCAWGLKRDSERNYNNYLYKIYNPSTRELREYQDQKFVFCYAQSIDDYRFLIAQQFLVEIGLAEKPEPVQIRSRSAGFKSSPWF